MQQEAFLKTLQEMKKSTEKSRDCIAASTISSLFLIFKGTKYPSSEDPYGCFDSVGHVGSGMMGKAQYSIPSESNFPST